MIELLDYVLDYDDNFWIIGCIDNEIKGYIVYGVDSNGNRYNNITKKNYSKNKCSEFKKIPPYKMVFKPNKFYLENKDKVEGVWKKYIEVLNNIGISDNDIGIFGSFLVGFDVIKDIDFVIYGYDNMKKYYDNLDYILEYTNSTNINKKHINYQYNKHKVDYSSKTDLLEIIGRNWSGIQVSVDVLSTPRFIDRNNQHILVDDNNRSIIKCRVIDGFKSSMLPRSSKVIYGSEEFTIVSPLWKYQSFLRRGDIIECLGSLNKDLKTITLYDNDCYVKFIKKGKNIL